MKKAYIILVHKNPEQLERLIDRLDDNSSNFFVHIDKKSSIPLNRFLSALSKKNIFFVKREDGAWGKLGIVKAAINGLEAIRSSKQKYDYISLITGQDYPIKDNLEIDKFLEKNYGKIFIEYYSLPRDNWVEGGMNRIEKYSVGKRRHPGFWDRSTSNFLNWLSNRFSVFKREHPSYVKPYGGGNWWTITFEAAEIILEFVKKHPDFMKFHRYTFIPDELIFQTILLNQKEIQSHIINNNLRYIDWEKADGASPPILVTNDFDSIRKSDKLFARKFDTSICEEVLDLIDAHCLKR